MSTHSIDVIRVHDVLPHPNADKLEIINVFGYTVCVGKGQFKPGDLAVYIPPDYEVPVEREEFAFLRERSKGKPYYRLRVTKMRGIISQGILIPAPDMLYRGEEPVVAVEVKEGDNLIDDYGIQRYEPPIDNMGTGGDNVMAPEGYFPTYDVEDGRRYSEILVPGEKIVVTEKIHGASGRWAFRDGQMYCGSRKNWKKEDERNIWWIALANHPNIRAFCEAHQDITVYGEVYGPVQNLKYGLREPRIAVFDLLRGNQWINALETREMAPKLPWVPLLFEGAYDPDVVTGLAEDDSSVMTAPNGHMREGVVVKPIVERTHPKLGRVQLKFVSNRYLGKEQ